ncbi:phage tail terminator-like protein [Pseudomonas eucalypticola]|uniref:DUF4128 domain-containing protein n=1 Tax=Pseudomonas eucalypticola TaxID=2599595 RepID=A0A7D5HI30_9PSED|nr:phage tail terminator-like protein [Pseudomonas eucalypticola]QKZ05826.1 DUF4128 domain-containing protein [Pseudomonas eucalypticola]
MSHKIIRSIYEQRLAAWATGQGLRVAYQNVSFEPAGDETYLAAFTLPAGTDSNTLAGDHKLYTGLFQVNVVTPAGNGPGTAESLVDDLASLFPIYLRLSQGDFTVTVMTPVDPGTGIVGDTTYSVPASFQYRADTE